MTLIEVQGWMERRRKKVNNKYTKNWLSGVSGVHYTYVCNVLSGRVKGGVEVIRKMSDAIELEEYG